jgi:hypothetical protein
MMLILFVLIACLMIPAALITAFRRSAPASQQFQLLATVLGSIACIAVFAALMFVGTLAVSYRSTDSVARSRVAASDGAPIAAYQKSLDGSEYRATQLVQNSATIPEPISRTILNESRTSPAAVGDASNPNDRIILHLTEESTEQLLKSELSAEQTSYLIQLPQQLSRSWALSPMSRSARSLFAGRNAGTAVAGFQALASVLSASVPAATSTTLADQAGAPVAQPAESAEASETAEHPEAAVPEWVRQPQTNDVVIETDFRLASEDPATVMKVAVSQALVEQLQKSVDHQLPAARVWTPLVRVQLNDETVSQCVVSTYDRTETIATQEGPQPMVRTIALVRFPASVKDLATDQIQRSLQRHRASIIALALIFLWMTITSAGLLLRFCAHGSGIRKLISLPAALIIPLPLSLVALALISGIYRQLPMTLPWEHPTVITATEK